MNDLTINEQKKYLSENLIVEDLRIYETNKEDIKHFTQGTKGSRIAEFLSEEAWDEDTNRNTKVFLIRDKSTRQIAFYYALNCGILYKEYNPLNLNPVEQEVVEKLIAAIRRTKQSSLSNADKDAANNLLSNALSDVYEKIEDSDRATNLIAIAEEQSLEKEEKEAAQKQTGDGEHTKQVQETFPAIDIKFLCRNADYHVPIKLDFKLGVYVFWEIIVPHIMKISELIGCKYIYLFAADNSETKSKDERAIPLWTPDYDPYADEEEDSEEKINTLVNYYINELKFRPVREYIILKPRFERECYTLVQEVSLLPEKREQIWSGHDADNEIDTYQEI